MNDDSNSVQNREVQVVAWPLVPASMKIVKMQWEPLISTFPTCFVAWHPTLRFKINPSRFEVKPIEYNWDELGIHLRKNVIDRDPLHFPAGNW